MKTAKTIHINHIKMNNDKANLANEALKNENLQTKLLSSMFSGTNGRQS